MTLNPFAAQLPATTRSNLPDRAFWGGINNQLPPNCQVFTASAMLICHHLLPPDSGMVRIVLPHSLSSYASNRRSTPFFSPIRPRICSCNFAPSLGHACRKFHDFVPVFSRESARGKSGPSCTATLRKKWFGNMTTPNQVEGNVKQNHFFLPFFTASQSFGKGLGQGSGGGGTPPGGRGIVPERC